MLRIPFTITLGAILLFANTAEAASLFFTPGSGEFGLNKEIVVDLKIDSEGVGINAGQATLRFPKDILEVKSVSKTDSAFNFWLEEPTFSNTDGVISFVGGTPYGISGASIQVLHIVFTAKSAGSAPVTIIDSAITASDGSGTNVLSKTTDANLSVLSTKISAPIIVTPPTQIIREPARATGTPEQPTLKVALYPDQAIWHNTSNVFTATWDLPRDIANVSTALNKQPNFNPTESEGLFDSKMFQPLSDGVWYLHVRFRNEMGWGATNHYRLAVDTKAPLPFEISSPESTESDNPRPVFNFKASDALSGIREYRLRVDNENWQSVSEKDFKGSYKLQSQTPGKHRLTVQAVDYANNSIEDTAEYETIPLASPIFTFATNKLFSDEAMGLSFKGTAIPSTKILLLLKKGEGLIASSTVSVDAGGNWEFTFSEPLRNGSYLATIQTTDSRGALSLVVTAPTIKVTGRYTNVITVTLVLLFSALIGGYFFYKTRRERTALRIQVAERDTANVFKMIESDIEKLKSAHSTSTPIDEEFIAKKLGENVKKMGTYIKDEIGRAKE